MNTDLMNTENSVWEKQLPLSFGQERLWFLAQMEGGSEAYHIPLGLQLKGELNRAALRQALNRVVTRHESLRTTFILADGKLLQRIARVQDSRFHLVEHDLTEDKASNAKLIQFVAQEATARFDLETGPLIRGRLIRQSENEHVLLITMHHIVSDGWSMRVVFNELSALYGTYARGQRDLLPKLEMQYADYAALQRRTIEGDLARQETDYWKRTLAGIPALLDLPTDYPRPMQQNYSGDLSRLALNPKLTTTLRETGLRQEVTLHMILLAAWAILLARLSGQQDIVIGSPVSNRTRSAVRGIVGFLANTLALRLDLSGSPTVIELLQRVKERSLAAQEHQDIPFERVVEIVDPVRSLAHTPIFQVMFSLQNLAPRRIEVPGLEIKPLESIPHQVAKFDLMLSLQEGARSITGGIEYATALFKPATTERYVGYLCGLLEEMANNPNQRVDCIPMLPLWEQRQMVYDWNQTETEYPKGKFVHELFAEQAQRTPEALAVMCGDQQLTYQELDRRSNQLANYLRTLGVGPEVRVGLCLERTPQLIVASLATMKASGAFVPLDPEYPLARLAQMLEDAQVTVVITQQHRLSELSSCIGSILDLDDNLREISAEDDRSVSNTLLADNLAYVIYTSGSTGNPKGVAIQHGSFFNYIMWVKQTLLKDVRLLPAITNFGFDACLRQLFWPLTEGLPVLLFNKPDPLELLELLAVQPQPVLNCVPSLWQVMLDEIERDSTGRNRNLDRVLLGGEPISRELAAQSLRVMPKLQISNLYGPTEVTVQATWADFVSPDPVSIGKPIANTQVYVVDEALQPVPRGAVGELLVGGVGLARGYLNQPALTAEKFVPNPFSRLGGERLYHTGDRVRWRVDGNLEFMGRADHQVKLHGYRIELGDIEARLKEHPGVREAAVVAREDKAGDKQLVAYYTNTVNAETEPTLTIEQLREHLMARLPGYMVPAAYVRMESFPLTANGKLDRKALPIPGGNAYLTREFEEPVGEVEKVLAEVWTEVLKIPRIGRHDNFFDLGGDSLLSIQLISRLRNAGWVATPKHVFQQSTIKKLAAVVKPLKAQTAPETDYAIFEPFALTPTIARVRDIAWPVKDYDSSALLQVPSDLKPDVLIATLQTLLDHHDMLRLQLDIDEKTGWKLHIQPPGSVPAAGCFKRVDFSNLDEMERMMLLKKEYEEAKSWLDPQAGRIVRAVWFDAGMHEPGALGLIINHLVMDAVSWQILVTDLRAAYNSLSQGINPDFGAKGTSYRQWSELLVLEANRVERVQEFSHWNQVLAKGGELTPDAHLHVDTTDNAGRFVVRLPASIAGPLLTTVLSNLHVGANDVLLTALMMGTNAWRRDRGETSSALTVDVNGHGREEIFAGVDLSRTIGWFTTLYPVRLDLTGVNPDALDEALNATKNQLRAAPDNGIGYGILRYLNREKGTLLKALGRPQVSFNYVGSSGGFVRKDWSVFSPEAYVSSKNEPASEPVSLLSAPRPLEHVVFITVAVRETGEGPELEASIGWAARILDEPEIRSLADHWFETLNRFVALTSAQSQTQPPSLQEEVATV